MLVSALLRTKLLQLAQPISHRGGTHGIHGHRPRVRTGKTSMLLHSRRFRRLTTKRARRPTALFSLHRHRKFRRRQHDGGSPAGHGSPFASEGRRPHRRATLLGRDYLPPDVRSPGPGERRTARPLGRTARHFSQHSAGRTFLLPTDTFPLAEPHTRNCRQRSVTRQRRDDRAWPSGNGQDHHPCGSHLRDAPPRKPSIGMRPKQHGRRLDFGETDRPGCGCAAHRQPFARE